MKKLVVFGLMALIPAASQSRDVESLLSMCEGLSDFAHTVMEARQAGVPASTLSSIANMDILRAVVVDAYRVPRYQTQRMRDQAATEFSNKVYVTCVDAI